MKGDETRCDATEQAPLLGRRRERRRSCRSADGRCRSLGSQPGPGCMTGPPPAHPNSEVHPGHLLCCCCKFFQRSPGNLLYSVYARPTDRKCALSPFKRQRHERAYASGPTACNLLLDTCACSAVRCGRNKQTEPITLDTHSTSKYRSIERSTDRPEGTHMYVCTCLYVYMCACLYIDVYLYMYLCRYACMPICIYVICMYA